MSRVEASTKPYLIRALHEWCTDQGFTPYLAVKVDSRTRVPQAFVRDGQIVLNVSVSATHQLQMTNTEITCQARFGGVAHSLYVPIECVIAIYARENGEGMFFEVAASNVENESKPVAPQVLHAAPVAELVSTVSEEETDSPTASTTPPKNPQPPKPPASPAGKSHLRVIK